VFKASCQKYAKRLGQDAITKYFLARKIPFLRLLEMPQPLQASISHASLPLKHLFHFIQAFARIQPSRGT
jgi:hypothetical protein